MLKAKFHFRGKKKKFFKFLSKILFDVPDRGGKWIVKKLKLKNIDLIIAVVSLGILAWTWNEYLKEFFTYLIGGLIQTNYFQNIPRTRVLSEYFVLLPLAYLLGYFHYKIKMSMK